MDASKAVDVSRITHLVNRRITLGIFVGLSTVPWVQPVVKTLVLPAHAQTSMDSSSSNSTDDTTNSDVEDLLPVVVNFNGPRPLVPNDPDTVQLTVNTDPLAVATDFQLDFEVADVGQGVTSIIIQIMSPGGISVSVTASISCTITMPPVCSAALDVAAQTAIANTFNGELLAGIWSVTSTANSSSMTAQNSTLSTLSLNATPLI